MDNFLNNQHGGNIVAFAKQVGCSPSEVIDLSSNINFVKPQIHFDFNRLDITAYPNYEELEELIAKHYSVKREHLELFNGATVAIYALLNHLKPKSASLYAPLYLEYEKALKLQNTSITYINRFKDITQEPEIDSLIIFVNPSTPDGRYYQLNQLMKMWIEKNCTIIIDESFLDFTPYKSLAYYLKQYNKLYILKSMTKFYAAAGMRIGALLSTKENIKKIKNSEPLWKISQFDSQYLQEALKAKNFKEISQLKNAKAKRLLLEILNQFTWVDKIYPSDANFILCRLKEHNAPLLQKRLMHHKILIRNSENFQFLDKKHIRVAVKSMKKLESLKIALQDISCLNK